MKIYTYYEDINHPNQEKMLQLWQTSWSNAGFDPIILTKKDAQNHNFYESFIEQIKKLHYEVMQKEINSYGLSCYVRWLAYATMPKEKFYVSDYDCINNGLKTEEPFDKLHLMDEACPCFVSGSPDQFDKLCYNFIAISSERIEDLKKLKDNSPCYHDQEFFQYNFVKKYNSQANSLVEKNNMLMTRDRVNGVGPYETNKINTCKVLHISHHNAQIIKNNDHTLKNYSINEIRIQTIEKTILQKK
jgi:hypothetical protein